MDLLNALDNLFMAAKANQLANQLNKYSMASLTESVSNLLSGTDFKINQGLRDLFIGGLNEMYGSEKKQVEVIEPQAESATSADVRKAILAHGEQTRQHVARLEQVYHSLGLEPQAYYTNTSQGVAADAEATAAHTKTGTLTRDAALLISGQKGEHYEIGVYNTLHTLAKTLGYTQATELLGQTLSEEKAANDTWLHLADSFVNQQAAQEGQVH